jgi:hypothetical protein
MALQDIEWDIVAWFNLAQDREKWPAVINTVISLWVEIFARLGCYAALSGFSYRRFGTSYRSHLQGRSSPRNEGNLLSSRRTVSFSGRIASHSYFVG